MDTHCGNMQKEKYLSTDGGSKDLLGERALEREDY